MKTLLSLLLFLLVTPVNDKINMLGIKINDSEKVLSQLSLDVVGREPGMTKFRTKDGNDFSVTVENGKIVYMENDWLKNPKNDKPLLTDFVFGKTSYHDIAEKLGSPGFMYERILMATVDDNWVIISCFEFEDNKDLILALVTTVSMDETKSDGGPDDLKLAAVILADAEYLSKIWGEKRIYNDSYKRIKL